ncbi:HEAT repeat domain-containing protein [Desulfogranum japonicum]|uniref:HEAT repeat domain-containing protein n=1 Tax=Desulfogranum japonicum TaxID=231447 RepID=UPI00042516E2|nr:HEAT repeat domain-containing protein [Desulfogranum japonicum]
MNSHPFSTTSEKNTLLLAFPLQFFTAMRTMRLYPPTNPQVLRNNKTAYNSFAKLLAQCDANTVVLAVSEQKILVNGEQLAERDQKRPQITGLRDFLNHIHIHSLSFTDAFNEQECTRFIEIFSELLGKREHDQPLDEIIAQYNISGVQVDEKKYVVVHKGEQVVKEEHLGMLSGSMPVSEEDMINYVLSQGRQEADLHGLSPDVADSILKKLAEATKHYDNPEDMNKAVLTFLDGIGKENDDSIRAQQIDTTAATIAGLTPPALSRFISSLPESSLSDDMLNATIGHLNSEQLNRLLANVVAQLPSMKSGEGFGSLQIDEHSLLNRFIRLADDSEVKKSIAQNVDARTLLANSDTRLKDLPAPLLKRLQQPEWSAPVLTNAIQQSVDPGIAADHPAASISLAHMLANYEKLLSEKQQFQVAHEAGSQLAHSSGLMLGKLITYNFKSVFGEQLYQQIIENIPQEALDQTLEQLQPEQLSHIISMLYSTLPATATGSERQQSEVLQRLLASNKGEQVQTVLNQHNDAQQLLGTLNAPEKMPDSLRQRLQDPQWSAPVLLNAARQAHALPDSADDGQVDVAAINRILNAYEYILDQDNQDQVSATVADKLLSVQGLQLGKLISHKFKGIFGEKVYNQLVSQSQDTTQDDSLQQLTPEQLNRLVTMMSAKLPFRIDIEGEPDYSAIETPELQKLLNSPRKEEVQQAIVQNFDARQLVDNPQTTLAELPPHLVERLKQPEWSGRVLANVAQQTMDPELSANGSINFAAFNTILGHFEQLLDAGTQEDITSRLGSQLAASESTALAHLLSHRFKGILGEKLYKQVLNQIHDDQLEATVDTLSTRQINKLIAILTSASEDGEAGLEKDEEQAFLHRLASTSKSPIIKQLVAQQLDAQLLRSSQTSVEHLPEQVKLRLQQPGWSSPVLTAAAHLSVDPELSSDSSIDIKGFNQILTAYESLLNEEKQKQVAASAGARIAEDLEERELGLILIQKYKGLFGEKFYSEVIRNLSDEKFTRLAEQMQRFATGQEMLPNDEMDQNVQEAYTALMKTVREQKLRTVVKIQEEKQSEQQEKNMSRISQGLKDLQNGDLEALRSHEFCSVLPDKIIYALQKERHEEADTLLAQLAVAQHTADEEIRMNSAQTLAAAAEAMAAHNRWPRLARLLPALEQMLLSMTADEDSITRTISAISKLAYHHLTQEEYTHAYDTIYSIKRLVNPTNKGISESVRLHAGEALEQISTNEVLGRLLTRFLEAGEGSDKAGKLLSQMGKTSASFQVDHLIKSDSRFERKRLLDLIKQSGKFATEILQEQLQQPGPWYVHRNIIRLLGDIGDSTVLLKLQPFLDHDDLRVQQETLAAAGKLGGEDITEFLIRALLRTDDMLKTKAASLMEIFPDERFVRHLTELLESTAPFKGKSKDTLHITICQALAAIGSRKALTSLQRVAQSKNVLGKATYSDSVRAEAEKTVHILKSAAPAKPDDTDQEKDTYTATLSFTQQEERKAQQEKLQQEEQAILHLAEQGKIDEAKKSLFDLISNTARRGDFENAERLRERFYDIDPMALSEIIRSGEIIEQEKGGAIREDDLQIWARLTDRLTSEEFLTIYHEFRERTYGPEENLVSQGTLSNELFFINQGSVKVSHLIGNKELFITTLSRGELAGENFFNPSIWTVSLTALTQARVYRLKQEKLAKWQEQFPGLRSKLEKFYIEHNNVPDLIQKKGLDRRTEKRFKLSRKIQVQPTDNQGKPIGKGFRAELADISRGGLAFLIRITRKENTRLLLGRKMQVVLPVGIKGEYLYLKGTAIGIQPHDLLTKDYGVHFTFDLLLENNSMQKILG